MSEPRLAIFGYSEAAMFLRGAGAAEVKVIVSIHGTREPPLEVEVARRLDLAFDDVEVAASGNDLVAVQRALSRKRWAEQNGLVEVAPTESDVAAIIRLAESSRGMGGVVLCHCGGGMSRAPAAALTMLSVWRGAGTESACVDEVLRLRRGAVPHAGLVRFADALLDRGGELAGALAAAMTHRGG